MNLHIVEVPNLSELMMTRVVKTLSIYNWHCDNIEVCKPSYVLRVSKDK